MRTTAWIAALISTGFVTPVEAHHSWSTDYDGRVSVTLVGTIGRLVYRSPHSTVMLDVETDNGRTQRWYLEWDSPSNLRGRGIDVQGAPHRDPQTRAIHLQSLRRLSDGLFIDENTRVESD